MSSQPAPLHPHPAPLPPRRPAILEDITQAIGDTPLLRLTRFSPGLQVELLAKLECLNPYSIKDRTVRSMVDGALAEGALAPGDTVIEATSGNTGIALAMLCATRGLQCTLVMSELQSVERRQVLRALGAELILSPAALGTKGARERAKQLAAQTGAHYLGQHDNPKNPLAHQTTTAEELWRDTDGRIDVLVSGLGTGGTLVGVARALKPRKPSFRTVGVEPADAPFISKGIFRPHRIMGTAPGFVPGVLERELIDEITLVSEPEAFEGCRRLARTEGLLTGISSGATAVAAERLSRSTRWRGKTIVCMLADSGQRYLSVEGLYGAP